jgi:hypothetical protein
MSLFNEEKLQIYASNKPLNYEMLIYYENVLSGHDMNLEDYAVMNFCLGLLDTTIMALFSAPLLFVSFLCPILLWRMVSYQ